MVPKERRIEAAHFYAHTTSGWYDLGPGTSGSLVACAGAAYFTRDPRVQTRPRDPAALVAANADLTVAFASKGRGNAFLATAALRRRPPHRHGVLRGRRRAGHDEPG